VFLLAYHFNVKILFQFNVLAAYFLLLLLSSSLSSSSQYDYHYHDHGLRSEFKSRITIDGSQVFFCPFLQNISKFSAVFLYLRLISSLEPINLPTYLPSNKLAKKLTEAGGPLF